LLCCTLLLAVPALAQDDDPTPKQQLAQIDSTLKDVERKRVDAEATETLGTLSENASQAKRDAEALEKTLQPQLDQLNEQLTQLGEAPKDTTEPPELAAQRRTLTRQ